MVWYARRMRIGTYDIKLKVGEVWMIEQILKILLFWLVVFSLVWIYVLIEDIKDRF